MKNPKILHVDLDAFYAAVEARDNPEIAGRPLIIGALPGERGVVATCCYEARKFGVRSAMNINEAYRRCPCGVFMRPDMAKYKEASRRVRGIWGDYTDACEMVSLDEGYLDVTGSWHLFGSPQAIAQEIRRRTREAAGITCSVGLGYSMLSAKLASEEKKPDGYFEIASADELWGLISGRGVRALHGVGEKTARELEALGISTVRQLVESEALVVARMGEAGRHMAELAKGIDRRRVTPHSEMKTLGTEQTFQNDLTDFGYLLDVLLLYAEKLCFDIRLRGLFAQTVALKVTYADMRSVTRQKTREATNSAREVFSTASELFGKIDRRPLRLLGLSLGKFSAGRGRQLSLFEDPAPKKSERLDESIMELQKKYGPGIVKTANVLRAEKRRGAGPGAWQGYGKPTLEP